MAIMEVLVETQYFGQNCINRWNYRSAGTPAAVSLSFACASALGFILGSGDTEFPADTVAGQWQALVSDSVQYVQIQVKDVYNPTDFYLTPFPAGVVGEDSGSNGVSPATAYGAKSNRTRLDIKPGTKRFVGVTEGGLNAGGDLDPAKLTDLQQLCDQMGNSPTYDDEGNIITFDPIIVSKEAYTTPSGNTAYRYYGTEAEQLNHIMDSILWSPYSQSRTQVSRQYGRGN